MCSWRILLSFPIYKILLFAWVSIQYGKIFYEHLCILTSQRWVKTQACEVNVIPKWNILLASERSERDAYRSNTIEHLYIYVWTCHFVLWPSRIFVLARCSTPSQTSLNGILRFSDHYLYHPKNWIVYRSEFLVKTQKLNGFPFLFQLVGGGKLISYLSQL